MFDDNRVFADFSDFRVLSFEFLSFLRAPARSSFFHFFSKLLISAFQIRPSCVVEMAQYFSELSRNSRSRNAIDLGTISISKNREIVALNLNQSFQDNNLKMNSFNQLSDLIYLNMT